ncbi:type II toxin-antitoxin system RnlB family antitoxin [Aerococcaceae bacterium zg-ZUI334]|uniref:type II toxin-antitoxin system RnlB family antitoxin n=1 Tax=Aerococcaceae bacterium zg-252 TaxID=2796928 RepID=UPI001B9DDB2D|nr:type II toxin-antitoxin system RnlB family antitoxin [Aerococcaceae bacterium zg-ZUI334]
MEQYLINSMKQSDFSLIITLLDYKIQISRCLKTIRIFPNDTGKLLIDTLLCSGMNEYRFIETTLNEDGTIDLDNYEYVSVNDEVLKKANEIVKSQPIFLENSILPEVQIRKIKEG